jgi:hypothetical protein
MIGGTARLLHDINFPNNQSFLSLERFIVLSIHAFELTYNTAAIDRLDYSFHCSPLQIRPEKIIIYQIIVCSVNQSEALIASLF